MLVHAAIDAQQGRTGAVDWTSEADGSWAAYPSLQERIDAIAQTLLTSKQVLKSTLTLGDGWIQRVANNPEGERLIKIENMRSNLGKAQRSKELMEGRSG